MLNWKWIILFSRTLLCSCGRTAPYHIWWWTQGKFQSRAWEICVGCLTCTWCIPASTWPSTPGSLRHSTWSTHKVMYQSQHNKTHRGALGTPILFLQVMHNPLLLLLSSQPTCSFSRSSNPLLPSFTSAFSVSNTFCPLMSRWITLCWCRWLKPWRIQRKVRGTQVQSMLFSGIPPQPIMLQKWKVHSWS